MTFKTPSLKYKKTIYALLDAIAFPLLAYLAFDAVSMSAISIYSPGRAMATIIFSIAVLFLFPLLVERRNLPLHYILCPLVIILPSALIFLVLKIVVVNIPGAHFGWIPLELHHAPIVWLSLFIFTWLNVVPILLIWIVIVVANSHGNRFALLIFNIFLLLLVVIYTKIFNPDFLAFKNFSPLFLVMIHPLIIAIIFGAFKQPVFERRFSAVAILTYLALMNYLCMTLPVFNPSFPGIKKLYPAENQRPVIPLANLRDVAVDEESGYIYASWGPTSGVISINTESGEEIVYTGDHSRLIELSEDKKLIRLVGWLSDDFVELNAKNMRIARRQPLEDYGIGQPFMEKKSGPDIYISSYEPAVFARFDIDSLKPLALKRFKDNCYCGYFTFSEDGSRVYIGLIMVDVPMKFAILEMDAKSLDVINVFSLPEPPLMIICDEEHRRLFASGFYSDRFFEIDLESQKIVNTYHGAIHARFMLYDNTTNRIIAGSYYTGELAVVDLTTSEKLISKRVSRRIQVGHFNESQTRIYISTTEGIYQIDMNRLNNYLSNSRR